MRRPTVAMSMLLAGCFGEFDPDLVGFQPEEGMYSPCETTQECGSDGVCLGSEDIEIQFDDEWDGKGVCTRWAAGDDPELDCEPFPEGWVTAVPAFGMDNTGTQFCVLECAGNLKCPVGMGCVHIYSPTIMYESEVCL
jgi:hypothetical protein